ncbi:hypothetical protein AWZ03_009489 [Drosophila navojoa]|uniref:Secreted protein n=1 Tax=Drosophila navojoa TaxID=7232 RepID=A0A484B5Z3_DRONA|nr:hypothetical protein AWZ03_009489 [Drosophila navojoa]
MRVFIGCLLPQLLLPATGTGTGFGTATAGGTSASTRCAAGIGALAEAKKLERLACQCQHNLLATFKYNIRSAVGKVST